MHGALGSDLVVRETESREFPLARNDPGDLDGLVGPELVRVKVELLELVVVLKHLPQRLYFFQSNLAVVESEGLQLRLPRQTLDEGLAAHPGQVVVRHEQLGQSRVLLQSLRENRH